MMKKWFFIGIVLIAINAHSQTYKAMSYNIRYDNSWDTINHWKLRKNKIVQQLQYYATDFIGTQEGLSHQIHFLDSSLINYKYIGVGREDAKEKGEYTAIFYNSSQWKVLKQSTFWLSNTPNKVSVGWDAALERICTYGLFQSKTTGKKVWVFNAHFDHRGEKARLESAKLIVSMIKKLNTNSEPVILMGDFNSTPNSSPIQQFNKSMDWKLSDTPKALYGPPATFNNFDVNKIPTTWIDFIFTKHLQVNTYAHIDDRLDNTRYISDHLPVLITFNLQK